MKIDGEDLRKLFNGKPINKLGLGDLVRHVVVLSSAKIHCETYIALRRGLGIASPNEESIASALDTQLNNIYEELNRLEIGYND